MKKVLPAFFLIVAGLLAIQTEALAQRGWVRSTVYGNAGRHSALALDPNGNPILTFHHRDFAPGTIGTVGYVRKIGGSFSDPLWSNFFEVADTSDPGERIGLAIRNGNPLLLFRSDWLDIDDILGFVGASLGIPRGGLFFFPESVGTPWFDLDFGRGGAQVIFKAGSEGTRPGFDTGYPLTCFTEDADATNDQRIEEGHFVHFWNPAGTGWRCRRIQATIAGPLALSVDHEGIAHMVYTTSPSFAGISYRRSTPQSDGNYSLLEGSGAIHSRPLDRFPTNVADFNPLQMYLSIDTDDAPDPNNRAHICAYIPDQKRLIYLHYNFAGDELIQEAVDGTEATNDSNDVGKYCDIAVDRARDILHISYFDGTNNKLKYATKPIGGNSWTISNVDTGNAAGTDRVGQYSSIAVDAEGFVHISYYNSATDELKYATNHPGCGNEILEEGEACDDGNRIDRDACSAGCLIEGDLNADLSVTINAAPQTMLDNEAVAYTVNVVNNGPEVAPAAFLNINLAPGEVVQPPRGCVLIGSPPETIRCGPSLLPPGRRASMQFSSPSRTVGTRAVVAQIGSNGVVDPDMNNNQASVNLTINSSTSGGGGPDGPGDGGPPPGGGVGQGTGGGAGQGNAGGGEGGGGGGGEVSGGGCSLILPKK